MATALEVPITAPPAIQIPSSQWRMALKPAKPAIASKPNALQSSSTARRALPRSNTSRTGPPKPNNNPGSKPRSDYPVKKSHLDGEKWENCIRMQFALKPGCRKLLRKINYIGHWKARWRKFDFTRKNMGEGWRQVVNPNSAKWIASRLGNLRRTDSSQGSSHSWQGRGGRGPQDQLLRPGEEMRSRGHPPLLPPKPEGLKSWKGDGGVTRVRLDELERQWWGDGFPVYMSEEDRKRLEEGKECWLDEVD